jgi:queuine/archaeosine tRNA-ribosyltransferase
LTLHNLKFVADLMGDLRAALREGRFADAAAALRAGAPPGQAAEPS